MPLIFPDSPTPGQLATINGRVWQWDGYRWVQTFQGFTGSIGFTGSVGFVGSLGFTGSNGFTGSGGSGFTGSQGSSFDLGINYAYRAILM